ncbi:MAG: Flp pilus assembly protein CpaB [Proteobacteria bacterium]|nr:Flp pilus assembly protein CpaB [Pseudomonadota bacterium]
MNSKRVVFLLLAVIVAGLTAFMARAWLQSERAAVMAQAGVRREAPAPAPTLQVLVARTPVHTGQIVKPDDLRWQSWPEGSLAPTYVIEGKRPLSDFVGAVARVPIDAGEPISEGKLVLSGTRGFMAAVLQPGARAVSVPVTATSAVSGFIYAGDRVDVLLTHVLNTPGGQHNATETVLRNARVIAMDQKLDFSPGDKPDIAKTATLELTPKQSEIVTLAVKMGDLSLVLRSLQDVDTPNREQAADENAPAIAGDSYTQDAQVSRLIPQIPDNTPKTPTAKPVGQAVFLLRGTNRLKVEIDGTASGSGGDAATADAAPASETKAAEDKQNGHRVVPFTRTIPSSQQ